jgi:hypothetical protein
MSASPEPSPRCRACGADLSPGAERCDRCGTSQRVDKCPHCGATAGVSPDSELRFRCDVCGAPRVPPAPRGKRSGREIAPLRRAQAAASARARWRAATVGGGLLLGFDVLLLSLLLLISGLSFGLLLAGLVTVVPLAGLVLWMLGRARARGREIAPAIDAAWVAAATDVATQAESNLTAHDLATALGMNEAQAEELLALLEVNDVVRGAMTAGGAMEYAPRFRIGGKPEAAPGKLAAAEEEALAVEEAAAEAEGRAANANRTKEG